MPELIDPRAVDRRTSASTDDPSAQGLPLGIQFAADVGNESTLLALALQLEAAHPWPSLAD